MTDGGPISGTPIDQEYTDIRVIHRPPSVFQWVTGAAMQPIGSAVVSGTAGGLPRPAAVSGGLPKLVHGLLQDYHTPFCSSH